MYLHEVCRTWNANFCLYLKRIMIVNDKVCKTDNTVVSNSVNHSVFYQATDNSVFIIM